MSYCFFENRSCKYYPCHDVKRINCMFCFCPLYFTECGGNYRLNEGRNGKKIKDCSGCIIPHTEGGYDYVLKKLKEAVNKLNLEKEKNPSDILK